MRDDLPRVRGQAGAMEAATPTPVVVTKAGQVRGRLEGGVRTYLGVPYAAPPERFELPAPARA